MATSSASALLLDLSRQVAALAAALLGSADDVRLTLGDGTEHIAGTLLIESEAGDGLPIDITDDGTYLHVTLGITCVIREGDYDATRTELLDEIIPRALRFGATERHSRRLLGSSEAVSLMDEPPYTLLALARGRIESYGRRSNRPGSGDKWTHVYPAYTAPGTSTRAD